MKNRYFKTGLVSFKIADDGTSKDLPGAGRGVSPLSHKFSRRLRDLCYHGTIAADRPRHNLSLSAWS